MFRLKIRFAFLLFLFSQVCFVLKADESFFTKTETLYSVKNGNSIGDLQFNIEIKSIDANPKAFYLIIGDKGNDIVGSGENMKTLWIFNKNVNASDLKKDLKSKDYPLDVKDIREFVPFCENGIRFDLKDWEEIKRQTKFPFYINASSGDKIALRLHFYIASKTKKRTIIEDEAKIKLEFTIPSALKEKKQEGDVISLTERAGNLSAEEIQKQQADSLKQAQENERIQRTNAVNVFITEKNKEITSLLDEINRLASAKDAKISKNTIDSLGTVAEELRKKVDYWDKGYTDILLNDESLQDKFTKFNTDQSTISKKLENLSQQQAEKKNWMIYVGVGLGVLMLGGMFSMQIWNMAKMKRQLRKQQKMMDKRAFESIDINELDKI